MEVAVTAASRPPFTLHSAIARDKAISHRCLPVQDTFQSKLDKTSARLCTVNLHFPSLSPFVAEPSRTEERKGSETHLTYNVTKNTCFRYEAKTGKERNLVIFKDITMNEYING